MSVPELRVLSWGCGIQSTTLGEMSAQGVLERLDLIVTADTGWERQATYELRDWYAARWREMGLRVEVVSAGDIRQGGATEHIHLPFWTSDGGPLRRQCTRYFKLIPTQRKMREVAGYHATKPPHPKPGAFEVWLGISLDEWHRAKRNPPKYQRERWPLLELKMDRGSCAKWLQERDLPVPPKSACVCCPYRRASEWIDIREEEPETFSAAIEFDEANRHNPLAGRGASTVDELYIYKPGPLAEADLDGDASRERKRYGTQLPMMLCETGYCWV